MAKRYTDEYDEDEVRPRKKPSGKGPNSSGKKSSGKKKSGKKAKARKQRRRIILFIIEIIILIIAVMVLYMVLSGTKSGKVELKEKDIIINKTVQEAQETTMKGYRNIALFGVDSTTGALTKNTRSDTIMIASINQDTGECKLVSVYRDTYLNLSNDSYNKCNAAYAKGGPEQAINMLNMNLDMNITDFVTVGFAGLTDTIDALGGVTGFQRLDGLQATGYCRIRYTAGDDFKRAERQREVLSAVADQAKKASLPKLTETANSVFEEVYTSLDLSEIVDMLGDVGTYYISETSGFPQGDRFQRFLRHSAQSGGECKVAAQVPVQRGRL